MQRGLLSSSNFPRFDVNLNTGEPIKANRRTLVVNNTIYFVASQPSQVKVSVLPAEAAPLTGNRRRAGQANPAIELVYTDRIRVDATQALP